MSFPPSFNIYEKGRSLHKWSTIRVFNLRVGYLFVRNYYTSVIVVDRDSSLEHKRNNYSCKNVIVQVCGEPCSKLFYSYQCQCYETFYDRILRMFEIS